MRTRLGREQLRGGAGRGENLHRGLGRLTRSTAFFLLVSARGPDTKASHCSCCSLGSSAPWGGDRA